MPTIRGKTGCGVLRSATGPNDYDALVISDGAVAFWKLESESGGVFADDAAAYDFTIGDATDWTTSASGLPNGGGYTSGDGSITATTNTSGSSFNVMDGTAWAFELMFWKSGASGAESIVVADCDAGTGDVAWKVTVDSQGQPVFAIGNTVASDYLTVGVGSIGTSRWHHLVYAKQTGNTVQSWLNGRPTGSSSSTSGTARTPSASYNLYLGSLGNGIFDWSSEFRVSRFAIYNALPTNAQVKQRYLAMFGA